MTNCIQRQISRMMVPSASNMLLYVIVAIHHPVKRSSSINVRRGATETDAATGASFLTSSICHSFKKHTKIDIAVGDMVSAEKICMMYGMQDA
jgi:hypothetical protein